MCVLFLWYTTFRSVLYCGLPNSRNNTTTTLAGWFFSTLLCDFPDYCVWTYPSIYTHYTYTASISWGYILLYISSIRYGKQTQKKRETIDKLNTYYTTIVPTATFATWIPFARITIRWWWWLVVYHYYHALRSISSYRLEFIPLKCPTQRCAALLRCRARWKAAQCHLDLILILKFDTI